MICMHSRCSAIFNIGGNFHTHLLLLLLLNGFHMQMHMKKCEIVILNDDERRRCVTHLKGFHLNSTRQCVYSCLLAWLHTRAIYRLIIIIIIISCAFFHENNKIIINEFAECCFTCDLSAFCESSWVELNAMCKRFLCLDFNGFV